MTPIAIRIARSDRSSSLALDRENRSLSLQRREVLFGRGSFTKWPNNKGQFHSYDEGARGWIDRAYPSDISHLRAPRCQARQSPPIRAAHLAFSGDNLDSRYVTPLERASRFRRSISIYLRSRAAAIRSWSWIARDRAFHEPRFSRKQWTLFDYDAERSLIFLFSFLFLLFAFLRRVNSADCAPRFSHSRYGNRRFQRATKTLVCWNKLSTIRHTQSAHEIGNEIRIRAGGGYFLFAAFTKLEARVFCSPAAFQFHSWILLSFTSFLSAHSLLQYLKFLLACIFGENLINEQVRVSIYKYRARLIELRNLELSDLIWRQ